jgi:N-acetylglutamate synthase-like GNAT family acetyltransferase
MAVAGVFAAEKTDSSTLRILIDFVIPQYADHKVGKFLFQDSRDVFLEQGITKLVVDTGQIENEKYFRKMGFEDSPVYGRDQLQLNLAA